MRSGGDGEYPEPFTLFLASLATCAGIYVKSFCDQRGIPADNIRLTQAQNFNPIKKIIDQIEISIHVPHDFPEKYENAVINTASLCAVKRHLREDMEVEVKVVRS
ncbi:MAG: OsmC family protein [Bacteroidales bacterium]